jgi:hypothetical protein
LEALLRLTNQSQFRLNQPVLVASATDATIKVSTRFADPLHLPGIAPLGYGQDIECGMGRKAPMGHDVGSDRNQLKAKMYELLRVFAASDKTRMAETLFDAFLEDSRRSIEYFEHPSLTSAAAKHKNIEHFMEAAVSAPEMKRRSAGKTRIHQALQSAGWDIARIAAPKDLGVPAFNDGDKVSQTGDFANGLGLMINGVQHVYVFATHYCYDAAEKRYWMRLKYVFYDLFGLDDDDLQEYGAKSEGVTTHRAKIGITAWWQLQHQHGFCPLVTRIVLEKEVEAAAV